MNQSRDQLILEIIKNNIEYMPEYGIDFIYGNFSAMHLLQLKEKYTIRPIIRILSDYVGHPIDPELLMAQINYELEVGLVLPGLRRVQ